MCCDISLSKQTYLSKIFLGVPKQPIKGEGLKDFVLLEENPEKFVTSFTVDPLDSVAQQCLNSLVNVWLKMKLK